MKSALVALVFVTGMTAGCGSLDQTVEAFYGKPVQVPIGRVSSLSQGDMTPPTVTLFLGDFAWARRHWSQVLLMPAFQTQTVRPGFLLWLLLTIQKA